MRKVFCISSSAYLSIAALFLVNAPQIFSATVTPVQWMQAQTKPIFKTGHTLPLLGQMHSCNPPIDLRLELAGNWGYAVRLTRPTGESQLISACNSNPSKYKAAAMIGNLANSAQSYPAGSYLKNANGTDVVVNGSKIPSPEMSDAAFTQTMINNALSQISGQIPGLTASLAQVENWTEYMATSGDIIANGANDATVLAAKGGLSWNEYLTRRMNHYDSLMRASVKSHYPNVFYTAYTYEYGPPVTDLPSPECYWNYFNRGYTLTGAGDLLTKLLGQRAYHIAAGNKYYYAWLCAGYNHTAGEYQSDASQGVYSDLPRWMGYLKISYALGMLGGITTGEFGCPSYASFSDINPPKWLDQMGTVAHAHALASWLEPLLRNSELLTGSTGTYEFPTAFGVKSRVVVRKLNNAERWLVTAWAMDSVEREGTVTIPVLGDYTILARPCGTVHLVGKSGSTITTLWYDQNGMYPSLTASTLDTTQSASNPNIIMIDRPVFSTPGGIYGSAQSITLTCGTSGTEIRYTLNGSEPTTTSTLYTTAIPVTNAITIKAKAFKTGLQPSFTAIAKYTLLASAPHGLVFTPGLTYKYYEGAWQNMPNFSTLTPKSQGTSGQMLLSQFTHANDSFAVVFTGYLRIPTDGSYTFSIMSDDGSKMYLDTMLMVNNDGVRTSMARAYGPTVWIKAGYYPVTFSYFFLNGLLTYYIPEWEGPGLAFGRIPAEYLFTSTGTIGVAPQSGKAQIDINAPQMSLVKQAAGYVLTISTQGIHTVEIYSVSGRLLRKMNGENRAHYIIDKNNRAQGVLVVKISSMNKVVSKPLFF